jgi:four helix bundle suffix protein
MSPPNQPAGFLPAHGSYRHLLSHRKAEIVFDFTHAFCARFLSTKDRTVDQMIQAARSGKQNIIEGAKASKTSKEMELKLTNVARASLEELLGDYEDALRVRRSVIWNKDAPEAKFVRRLGAKENVTFDDFREFVETRPLQVVANIALCLVHQANYLLDQQIRRLEQDFLKEGGLRERMSAARRRSRCPS